MSPTRLAAVAAAIGVCVAASNVHAGSRCTDEPNFEAFVAAAKSQIDQQCDCANAESANVYKRCGRDVAKDLRLRGLLSRKCEGFVRKGVHRSTCGRPGRVICCITKANGRRLQKVRPSAAQCVTGSGGTATLGVTPSALDGCPTLPECDPTSFTETAVDAAIPQAIASLEQGGFPFDIENIEHRTILYHHVAGELGCALIPEAEAESSSPLQTCTASAPNSSLGPYDPNLEYCGLGCGHGIVLVRCDDCLNCACYDHDDCAGRLCVRAGCQFVGNGLCDENFFTGLGSCLNGALTENPPRLRSGSCHFIVRGIARFLGVFHRLISPECIVDPREQEVCQNACEQCMGFTGSNCDDQTPTCGTISANDLRWAFVDKAEGNVSCSPQQNGQFLCPVGGVVSIKYYGCGSDPARLPLGSCSTLRTKTTLVDICPADPACDEEEFLQNTVWSDSNACVEPISCFGSRNGCFNRELNILQGPRAEGEIVDLRSPREIDENCCSVPPDPSQ